MTTLHFVESLRELVTGVDVVLSDIWGVVHNGLVAFPEACEALYSFRRQGGTVILITNAPRPADSVQRQLRKLGVADETYDAIATPVTGEERDRIYARWAEMYPQYGEYQRNTTRKIPVIALQRRKG